MRIQPATRSGVTVSNLLDRPNCPHCDEPLFAAAATEFLGKGHIGNTWCCDVCDHTFRTFVRIPGEDA